MSDDATCISCLQSCPKSELDPKGNCSVCAAIHSLKMTLEVLGRIKKEPRSYVELSQPPEEPEEPKNYDDRDWVT